MLRMLNKLKETMGKPSKITEEDMRTLQMELSELKNIEKKNTLESSSAD